jgi:integrase
MATGIRQRHGRGCSGKGRCTCPWQAEVYSKKDGKKIRKAFPTRAAAGAWRDDSRSAVRQKLLRAPTGETLREAALGWQAAATEGVVRTRSGDVYKPGALRTYEKALRLRVLPHLGSVRLSEVGRTDLQDIVDNLLAEGVSPSTVAGTMLPARAIYRRAMSRGEVAVNPTTGLAIPAARGRRERIASPDECVALLAALSQNDRALWATAMYGGLRRGELMALRIEDVDLGAGVIHVRRGWDVVAGEIATKSGKDRRVPISAVLRDYLDEHLLALDWADGFVFGSTATSPFKLTAATRAQRAWKVENERRIEAAQEDEDIDLLAPITLHECRHTFASLMIAAGVNAKALSTYMGHAAISITLDRYGHLMPGNEAEAAGLLDAYLARADTKARLAQLADTTGTNPGTSTSESAL